MGLNTVLAPLLWMALIAVNAVSSVVSYFMAFTSFVLSCPLQTTYLRFGIAYSQSAYPACRSFAPRESRIGLLTILLPLLWMASIAVNAVSSGVSYFIVFTSFPSG